MNSLGNHLSDEALDEILIGAGSAADEAHLAVCSPCTERFEAFRGPMALFSKASAEWSQARSNTISRELTPRRTSFGGVPTWSLVTAVVLAVGFAIDSGMHREAAPVVSEVSQQSSSERQQEIASDNAMLAAIDSELSRRPASPVDVYDLDKSGRREAGREVRN